MLDTADIVREAMFQQLAGPSTKIRGMTTLPDLHDGFFDGLLVSADKRARFFVRTVAGERSTIILTDVEALNICGLRLEISFSTLCLSRP